MKQFVIDGVNLLERIFGECGEGDGKTFRKNKIKTSVRATKH